MVARPVVSREFEPRNQLLAALPVSQWSTVQPHLEAVPLARGSVIVDVNEPLTRVYFVEAGVVSLLAVLENGATAGVATVGQEGVVGSATLLLGGESAPGRYQVLVPGAALAMEVSPFRSALRESSKLQAACETYSRAIFAQVLQTVACSRMHTVEERCARWLLMCDDRTAADAFEVGQECLAHILGVSESTLSVVSGKLQNAGLICCCRGAITVVDRRGLETAACECYRIIRDRYRRLLAPTFG